MKKLWHRESKKLYRCDRSSKWWSLGLKQIWHQSPLWRPGDEEGQLEPRLGGQIWAQLIAGTKTLLWGRNLGSVSSGQLGLSPGRVSAFILLWWRGNSTGSNLASYLALNLHFFVCKMGRLYLPILYSLKKKKVSGKGPGWHSLLSEGLLISAQVVMSGL